MKKFILSILTLVLCAISYGQDGYKKLPSIGVHFIVNDFQTAADIRATGLADVLREKQYKQTSRMNAGMAISYIQGLSEYVDFSAALSGSFVDYAVPYTGKSGRSQFFMEAAATANLKLLTDKYVVSPYLTFGIGAFSYRSSFGAFLPVGAGIQVKVTRDLFFLLNSQYRIPVTDKAVYHFHHSIGVAAPIVKRKEPVVIAPPPPVVLDRDGDGINDVDDKCPDTPGIAALMGCPDRDGDGIADAEDKCPDVAGLLKYGGCPIPDTDGDGINDEMDKCPDVKGFARYEGCPIPDTDGDGVNDEEDKCPNRAGPADNFGCPVIGIRAYEIAFKSGSAVLLPRGKQILDTVVTYLNNNPGVNVTVEGHTDNSGTDKINQPLSEKRAQASKAYMVSKGIDPLRMTTAGYGSTQPVADNKTADGRKKNRRIEIKIKQ